MTGIGDRGSGIRGQGSGISLSAEALAKAEDQESARRRQGYGAALAAFFAAALAGAEPAAGQVACAPRDTALDYLARVYGEAPVAAGVANSGGLIEVLASAETGTWTIIVTSPRGLSCSVAAGEGWRDVAPKPAAEGGPGT